MNQAASEVIATVEQSGGDIKVVKRIVRPYILVEYAFAIGIAASLLAIFAVFIIRFLRFAL